MQLTVTNNFNYPIDNFIYNYLTKFIYDMFIDSVDKNRLEPFDEMFDIDSYSILSTALRNLLVTKNGTNEYNIKINNTIKVNGNYINYYINLITYGNREIKGYPILLAVFEVIKENIDEIYREWEE